MTNVECYKQPIKYLEVPLNKFCDEVIPHHQSIYEHHKATVNKLISINNTDQLNKIVKERKRTVKQLKDLMYELDTLRAQVEDSDLDLFDARTLSLRKIILKLISGYNDIEKVIAKIIEKQTALKEDVNKENCNPFEGASQIQVLDSMDDLKLKSRQAQLDKVTGIHSEVKELHAMYEHLNDMVQSQAEPVNRVENNVESANENVQAGTRQIIKAHKLKQVAYPVTGAFLGGIIGGPIGLIAGLKVGGIAALGCAIAGYTGGRFVKKMNGPENIENESQPTTEEKTEDPNDKKGI